jgi:hypothetical protein
VRLTSEKEFLFLGLKKFNAAQAAAENVNFGYR